MLAHELRNPLAPMTTATELLGTVPSNAMLDELRRMIARQLNHLTRLVDDLLDTSRITTGRIILQRTRVDLGEVVRHSLETSRPLIVSRGHEIVSIEHDEPVLVEADPVRLAQVVTNLLNNSAKFTPPGGRIELRTFVEGDNAVVSVSDTGIGIVPETLPHVFDRQKRVDEPHEDAGLGLGLSLVKRLVELHGGTVEARSAGSGCGATFVIRLPLVEVPFAAVPLARAASEEEPPPSRRILIVDDNDDAAASLALLLSSAGHEVRDVRDARSALEAARSFVPDVVLLDIGLPDMDGWELARLLRAETGADALKLIAISGYGQRADRRRSRDAGIDHHLTKPVDYASIARCL
jgi:CheY-like chemotaxis protein